MWARDMPARASPKSHRAAMKQVVGMPFAGLHNKDLELEIIRDLAAASKRLLSGMGGLTQAKRRQVLEELLENLLSKVRQLIGSRVQVYLRRVAERLFDPTTNIAWSSKTNTCQDFCDSLLDPNLFGPLFAPTDGGSPLYLMSFVCRPAPPTQPNITTKFDVPLGLHEEYLFNYHYGGPSSDIIDTLSEYFYDWSAFGRSIYPLQNLFPWDCSEACNRDPTRCGKECNLAKHIWAFPFDSWSIISLHLTRSQFLYPPTTCHRW